MAQCIDPIVTDVTHTGSCRLVQSLGPTAAKEYYDRQDNELGRTVEHWMCETADGRSWRRSVMVTSWQSSGVEPCSVLTVNTTSLYTRCLTGSQ